MFRRKRNSSRTPQNPNPSPSAQTAAAQAFLASQASSTTLSSAAAATALRTLTPTPTPIENVQTKRMLQRRSSSTSSRGIQADSLSDGPGGRGLHRSSSSGSMTTRAFRGQSPSHPTANKGSQHVPPVPPLPQNYPMETTHRRTSSVEPAFRTSSPQLRQAGGRGGSLDRSIGQMPTGSPTHRYSSLRSVPEVERPESRGSINFSYPINSPSNSPRQSPVPVERHPNNNILANGFVNQRQPGDRPVKKKKKKKAINQPPADEALPSRDTTRDPRNVPPDALGVSQPKEEAQPFDSHTPPHALSTSNTGATSTRKKKKKKKNGELESSETTSYTYGPNRDGISGIGASYQGSNATLRSAPTPKKRPSMVREDPEGEEREEREECGLNSSRDVDLTTHSSKGPLQNISNEIANHTAQSSAYPSAGLTGRHGEASQGKQPVESQSERRHSLSPTRSTRFSSQLVVTGTAETLHEPPPRSVSPAKSAMKAPHPSCSLPPDVSCNWPKPPKTRSETSEGTSATSEDGSRIGSKKRAITVSFEDEAEIVGTAASPPTSPESSAPLSPLGKSTMPRYQWDDDEYGYGEVMRPRPALPSFGSVRCRREEVIQEDPSSDFLSDASSIASSMSNLATVETSLSSDHALGPMLAAETRRAAANGPSAPDHATKVQEPLPPKVTSIDGTGYSSDSDVEVRHDTGPSPAIQYTSSSPNPIDPRHSGNESNLSTPSSDDSANDNIKTIPNGSIPLISVLPATPALEEERRFPTSFDQVDKPSETPENSTVPEHTPITKPIDAATNQGPSDPVSAEQPSQTEDSSDDSDSSGESIYSDAAEDLSDLEGDGFGSINAIVESPVTRWPNISRRTPPESPTRSNFSQITGSQSPVEQKPANASEQAPLELLPSVLPVVEEEPSQNSKPMGENKKEAMPKQSEPPALLHTDQNKENTASKVPALESHPNVRRPAPDEYGVAYSTSFHRANGHLPSMPGTAKGNSPKTGPTTLSKATTLKKNTRPMSSGPLSQASAVPAVASPASGSWTPFPQALQRTLSNGSDSSSSFKRSKRPSKPEGQHTMRRTMRASPGYGRPWSQDGKARSNSIRSLSPQGKRPFSSSSNGSLMRRTLRGPSNSNTSNLKDGKQANSATFPGLGKSASLKKAPGKPGVSSNARLNTRFENSSDEDVSRFKNFQSRFEDSSDDEPELEKFRPVRGIPRRKDADDGDSTDLEDSSNDGRVIRRGSRRRLAVTTGPMSGSAMSATAAVAASKAEKSSDLKEAGGASGNINHELEYFLPGKKEKKPSLFHRLTLSKRGLSKDSGIHKSQLDSAARRDTSLERSRSELERMRLAKLLVNEHPDESFQTTITGGDAVEQHGLQPSSSKLRKKSGGGGGVTNNTINEQAASGSWPLRVPPPEFYSPPEPIPENTNEVLNQEPSSPPATEDRPHTADGIIKEDPKKTPPSTSNAGSPSSAEASWASRFRPRLSRRQGTDSTCDNPSIATSDERGSSPTTVGDVVVDKGSRRKKFPLLRRALRIDN